MIAAIINTKVHDKAQIASVSFSLLVSSGLGLLKDRLYEQLKITNKWADEQGALIGHVKAYIQWGQDEALMLSTTGEEVDIKGSELPIAAPENAEVGITAIVFGVELKMVKDRLVGITGAIAGQYGEYCIYKAEHKHDHEHNQEHNHNHKHQHDSLKIKTVKVKKHIHNTEHN